VNLLALVLGMMLIPLIDGNKVVTWILFVCLTVLHLYANYRGVCSVVLNSINRYDDSPLNSMHREGCATTAARSDAAPLSDRHRMHLLCKDFVQSSKVQNPTIINGRECIIPYVPITRAPVCILVTGN